MNRNERRKMSKKLGIMSFQQKLPRNKKFELIRENIIAGKQRQIEMKEENRISSNAQNDGLESKKVYNKTKENPTIDVMKEAREKFENQKNISNDFLDHILNGEGSKA